jgi:hypothetical protein
MIPGAGCTISLQGRAGSGTVSIVVNLDSLRVPPEKGVKCIFNSNYRLMRKLKKKRISTYLGILVHSFPIGKSNG